MNEITKETRRESNEKVNKELRHTQIKNILMRAPNGLTAKEVAVRMHERGYIDSTERNFSAPRLTELEKQDAVEVIGKKRCDYSNKTVAVYKLK